MSCSLNSPENNTKTCTYTPLELLYLINYSVKISQIKKTGVWSFLLISEPIKWLTLTDTGVTGFCTNMPITDLYQYTDWPLYW